VSTYGTGFPINPTPLVDDEVRRNFQVMVAEGPCQLLAPLRYNRVTKTLEVDTSGFGGGGTPQEVIDARTGPPNWTVPLSSQSAFASLDARLDQMASDLNVAMFLFMADPVLAGFVLSISYPSLSYSSLGVFGLNERINNQQLQTGGAAFLLTEFTTGGGTNNQWPASISVPNGPNSTPNTNFQLRLQSTAGHTPSWNNPGPTYSQNWANNMIWQLAETSMTLRVLIESLKNKGILQ